MDQYIQAVMAIGVPTLAVLTGILINNSRLGDLNGRFGELNSRFGDLNGRMGRVHTEIRELRADMNRQFDDTKALWRSELHRVEEVLDARLKPLEER
jgi:hypothetical protein